MNFIDSPILWLPPIPPALYYLYATARAQAMGINAMRETEIRLAVGALSVVILYAGMCILLSEPSVIRVGLAGLLQLNINTLGFLLTVVAVTLAYAAKNAQLESISPCVWLFGISRDIAELEMSRESAISAKRRVSQARKRAAKTGKDQHSN